MSELGQGSDESAHLSKMKAFIRARLGPLWEIRSETVGGRVFLSVRPVECGPFDVTHKLQAMRHLPGATLQNLLHDVTVEVDAALEQVRKSTDLFRGRREVESC